MSRMLVEASRPDEVRVAIVNQKNRLMDLYVKQPGGQDENKANIYVGEISSIEPHLGAVFVNYGEDHRHGFLPLKEISPEYYLVEPELPSAGSEDNRRGKQRRGGRNRKDAAHNDQATDEAQAPNNAETNTQASDPKKEASPETSTSEQPEGQPPAQAASMPANPSLTESTEAPSDVPNPTASDTPSTEQTSGDTPQGAAPKQGAETHDASQQADSTEATPNNDAETHDAPKKAAPTEATPSSDHPTASPQAETKQDKTAQNEKNHDEAPQKEAKKGAVYLTGQSTPSNLKKMLKVGQKIVVQVEKEERGNKGAALTTYISLAGAYLVLMPNNPRAGGVSRRIEGEERDQLRSTLEQLNIPEGMGVIVRTAGVGKETSTLAWDLQSLLHQWQAIIEAVVHSEPKKEGCLIYREGDTITCAIRDLLQSNIEEIIIDDETAFQKAKHYLETTRPDFAHRIKLHQGQLPLYSQYQIEKQVESAYRREVRLPSGGSLVIDHTEALVSVDINSSRATRGADIEETAFNTNLEAAEEIARQLRIRDIGGLVVIDFIDMGPQRHQRDVEQRLRDSLRLDRARIQVGRISRFGLMEMSRQRIGRSLRASSHITCPRCSGHGTIRNIESLCLSILHLIGEQASRAPHQHFQLQLPVDVSSYMINEKRHSISEIELSFDAHIMVIPNPHITSPQYHLKHAKVDPETSKQRQQASYKMLKQPRLQQKLEAPSWSKPEVKPASEAYLTQRQPLAHHQPSSQVIPRTGLFRQLWHKMFGGEAEALPPVEGAPQLLSPSEGLEQAKQNRSAQKRRRGGQQRRRRAQGNRPNNASASSSGEPQDTPTHEGARAAIKPTVPKKASTHADERSGQNKDRKHPNARRQGRNAQNKPSRPPREPQVEPGNSQAGPASSHEPHAQRRRQGQGGRPQRQNRGQPSNFNDSHGSEFLSIPQVNTPPALGNHAAPMHHEHDNLGNRAPSPHQGQGRQRKPHNRGQQNRRPRQPHDQGNRAPRQNRPDDDNVGNR